MFWRRNRLSTAVSPHVLKKKSNVAARLLLDHHLQLSTHHQLWIGYAGTVTSGGRAEFKGDTRLLLENQLLDLGLDIYNLLLTIVVMVGQDTIHNLPKISYLMMSFYCYLSICYELLFFYYISFLTRGQPFLC